jgi:hypothetical protein
MSLLNTLCPHFNKEGRVFLERGKCPSYTPFASTSEKKGSVDKRGGEAPSLKFFPPLLLKERGK